jgi:hypothetical protein
LSLYQFPDLLVCVFRGFFLWRRLSDLHFCKRTFRMPRTGSPKADLSVSHALPEQFASLCFAFRPILPNPKLQKGIVQGIFFGVRETAQPNHCLQLLVGRNQGPTVDESQVFAHFLQHALSYITPKVPFCNTKIQKSLDSMPFCPSLFCTFALGYHS